MKYDPNTRPDKRSGLDTEFYTVMNICIFTYRYELELCTVTTSIFIDTTRSLTECYIGGSTPEKADAVKVVTDYHYAKRPILCCSDSIPLINKSNRSPAKIEPDIIILTAQDSDLCSKSLRNRTGILLKIISKISPRRSQDSKDCLLK